MKALVVFDTSYGNTRTVAETISATLKESGLEVDTSYVKKTRKINAEDYSILVLGSPTRFGTMSFAFKGFLAKMNPQSWSGKVFAAFDTETRENIDKKEGSAAEKIAARLLGLRMNQVSPVLKAIVTSNLHCTLEAGEIERAREFARGLAGKLKESELVSSVQNN